jgi:hypothetical protein
MRMSRLPCSCKSYISIFSQHFLCRNITFFMFPSRKEEEKIKILVHPQSTDAAAL